MFKNIALALGALVVIGLIITIVMGGVGPAMEAGCKFLVETVVPEGSNGYDTLIGVCTNFNGK